MMVPEPPPELDLAGRNPDVSAGNDHMTDTLSKDEIWRLPARRDLICL